MHKSEKEENVVVLNPEIKLQTNSLTYRSAELQDILNDFNAAANFSDVHRYVIDLLQHVANFRYATVPNGVFSLLRNKKKTNHELKQLVDQLQAAFNHAKTHLMQLNADDKKILELAFHYAAKSVLERIHSLKANDRILEFWNESHLKKMLG